VGLLEGFSLGSYLLLVDWTSRLVRQGKARLTAEVASVLERLGSECRALAVDDESIVFAAACLRDGVCLPPRSLAGGGGETRLPSPGESQRLSGIGRGSRIY
jgi:hypothetical protein